MLNKEIDFKKEVIDLIFKIYSEPNPDEAFQNSLLEIGIPKNKLDQILGNYNLFKEKVKNEANIPSKLIPYFTMKTTNYLSLKTGNDLSILNKLYVYRLETEDLDYKVFLNRFFQLSLAFKEDYSDTLDFNDILNIVNGLDIEDRDKLNLINFYNGGEELFIEIKAVVSETSKIIEKYYHLVEKDIDDFYNELSQGELFSKFFEEYFKVSIDDFKDAKIAMSISNYNFITRSIFNKTEYIFIGYLVLILSALIKEYNNDEEESLNILKSLSDPTRYKILKILSEKKTYGNDIANILNISAPTINHHLNILLNHKLIRIYLGGDDNKKIYYEINKTKLQHVLDVIRRNLL